MQYILYVTIMKLLTICIFIAHVVVLHKCILISVCVYIYTYMYIHTVPIQHIALNKT